MHERITNVTQRGYILYTDTVKMMQSCPRVGLTHGLGWVEIFQFFGGLSGVGSTIAKVLKFERIMLMHLKRGQIRFGCTKQLNLLVASGWVGLDLNFSTCSGSGWVSQLMGWVGSGHIK